MRAHSLLCIATLLASPLAAQGRATELGVGLSALGVDISGGQSTFIFATNQQYVAVALYPSSTVAIQPSVAVSVQSGGGTSLSVVSLGLSAPIYTQPTWGHSGLFLEPGIGVRVVSASAGGASASATQFSLGFAIGSKFKLSDPVSLSFGANIAYGLATTTLNDVVSISAQLGLSVFLK